MATIKWKANSVVNLLTNKTINNGATDSATFDNHINNDRYATIQLQCTLAIAPGEGEVFTCWLNPRVLGQSTDDTLGVPITFPLSNTTNAQTTVSNEGLFLSPLQYDIVVRNDSGQNATGVNLAIIAYNEEIQ